MTGTRSVIVTGATGFVGSHLTRRLVELGYEVMALARSVDAVPDGARPIKADLEDPGQIRQALEACAHAVSVVHLGGFVQKGAGSEYDDARAAVGANVVGTLNLLRGLSSTVRHVVYVSTLDVYGLPRVTPVTENHPTAPRTYYGASKLAAEALCRVYGAQAGISVTVLRLGQVYGPGNTHDKAINRFIRAALYGQPVVVHNGGADIRDLVFVADVVQGIVATLERRVDGVFNIASGRPCRIGELAELVSRQVEPPATIRLEPKRRPATEVVLSIARAAAALGYGPSVPLEEGVRLEMAWHREQTCLARSSAQD